jgi:hypothetical protein
MIVCTDFSSLNDVRSWLLFILRTWRFFVLVFFVLVGAA